MKKITIKLDQIATKFIAVAIQFQKESGIVFEHDTDEQEFLDCYGFSRSELNASLSAMRAQLPIKKSMREEILDGKYDKGKIRKMPIYELKNLIK